MSNATRSIFPIENGKLTTVLDCNNLQLINLDASNLNIPSNGGGGGGGGEPVPIEIDVDVDVTVDPTDGATVYHNISQTLINNTLQFVGFNTQISDVGGLYDPLEPTKLTAQTAGFYTITAEVMFTSNVTGRRLAILMVNGTTEIARSEVGTNQLQAHACNLAATYYMNVGDYVQVEVLQTSGIALEILGGIANTQSPFLAMAGGNINATATATATGTGTVAGGGNDTGTTTAILKGDGDHGFADAIAGTDYITPSQLSLDLTVGLALKEDITDHDADLLIVTTDISTLNTNLAALTTTVGTKANSSDVTTALALKTDLTTFNAYVTSNNTAVGLKADTSTVNTALGNKADTSALTAGLATKEPTLPTTSSNGFVLVRDVSGTWRFVDPVTLGSTNFSGSDGATHSNTTFNSTQAVFTTNDTGKTIVCAGNILSSTTITFVNATTVTLSNAATTTASGLTFTILNRFLSAGSGGTVTNVSVTYTGATGVSDLTTIDVTNSTTTPVITITKPATTFANTFYGNGTPFDNQRAAFMSAATARTALGGTTVGQAIFQLANPGATLAPGYIRTNADNSVTALTRAATLSDLGAETALTFSSPLVRSINAISMPAAGTSSSGYLTQTDWGTFNNKVTGTGPTAITLTGTAPLTIDGGNTAVNLSANRVFAIPRSAGNADGTGKVNGYLHGDDFVSFVNKPPNTRSLAVTAPLTMSPGTVSPGPPVITTGDLSANRTVAIPKATPSVDGYLDHNDFARFNTGGGASFSVPILGGTSTPDPNAVPPITKIYLTQTLTSNLNIVMPPAATYAASNLSIEIIDVTTGGAAPGAIVVNVSRSGSDSVDGLNQITLPEGATYTRFFPNGGPPGRWISTKYFVDSFKDPVDATKAVRVALQSGFASTTKTLTLPLSGDSVTVVPNSPIAGEVVRGITASGAVSASRLTSTEIIPTEFPVGDADTPITNDGTIDTVRITTTLTATRIYTLPNASLYSSGEVIRFYDSTGNPNNQVARVRAATGETINGLPSIDINQGAGQNFNRTFVASPTPPIGWTAETLPGSIASGLIIDPWHTVVAGSTTTIVCNSGVTENHHIVTMSANTTLAFSGLTAGQTGLIKFRDSIGGKVVTTPVGFGKTPTAGGVGVFTTSSGGPIEDLYHWSFDGQDYTFVPMGLKLVAAAIPTFSTIADDTATGLTTSGSILQGNVAGQKFLAARVVADGGITNGATYIVGKVRLVLTKNGNGGSTNFTVSCYTDTGSNSPLVQTGGSASVTAASITTAEQLVDFSANFDLTGARNVTVNTATNNATITGANGSFTTADVGSKMIGANIPANARITAVDTVNGATATITPNAGVTAGTGVTISVRRVYWIVLTGDNAGTSGTNNISWHFSTMTSDPTGFGRWAKQATGGPWQTGGTTPGTSQPKYILFK